MFWGAGKWRAAVRPGVPGVAGADLDEWWTFSDDDASAELTGPAEVVAARTGVCSPAATALRPIGRDELALVRKLVRSHQASRCRVDQRSPATGVEWHSGGGCIGGAVTVTEARRHPGPDRPHHRSRCHARTAGLRSRPAVVGTDAPSTCAPGASTIRDGGAAKPGRAIQLLRAILAHVDARSTGVVRRCCERAGVSRRPGGRDAIGRGQRRRRCGDRGRVVVGGVGVDPGGLAGRRPGAVPGDYGVVHRSVQLGRDGRVGQRIHRHR